MARLPEVRVEALADLARQLRFEPPDAARRQLGLTEQLARDLLADDDLDRAFPEDFIIFRVTGYRAQIDEPALVLGTALLADLGPLAEQLSVTAQVRVAELDEADWLRAETLMERWSISRKTLDRYRRRGLLARRAASTARATELRFDRTIVEAFERANRARLGGAARFTRIDDATREEILDSARVLVDEQHLSAHAAAGHLAAQTGRSREAIRLLLTREGLNERSPPVSARLARALERAHARGADARWLAERTDRTSASVHRAILQARADRLRQLGLVVSSPPDQGVIQEVASVGDPGPPPETLAALQAMIASDPVSDPRAERLASRARRSLLARAASTINDLDRHHPASGAIDQAETDLRCASRLKWRLVCAVAPLVPKTIDATVPRPIESMRPDVAASLVRTLLDAIGEAVDTFDPERGGRLAAPSGLAMNRAVSAWIRGADEGSVVPTEAGRAVRRTDAADVRPR